MPKLKNSNATFWVIFKHCVSTYFAPLKSEIVERKEVTQSPIRPGTNSGGTKLAQAEAIHNITLGT